MSNYKFTIININYCVLKYLLFCLKNNIFLNALIYFVSEFFYVKINTIYVILNFLKK